MPDSKITALTALTAADPAADMFPVVDVSDTTMAASGTTKRISINNILACSPTATLASATITGDLTVDTSTLKVDSANDRVGIGTVTPVARLIVRDGLNRNLLVASDASHLGSAGIAIGSFTDNAADWAPLSLVAKTQIAFGLNGSTAMTLNSTGLLVGASASGNGEKFNANGTIVSIGQSIGGFAYNQGGFDYSTSTKNLRIYAGTSNATGSSMSFVVGTSTSFLTAMTLDASGNLGIGVTTPSYRLQATVASGADRNIFGAQVAGASNGLQVLWNHATTTLRIVLANIPTSAAGLATGTLWNDAGTIKIA